MADGYVAHYTTPLNTDELHASFSQFDSAGLPLSNPNTGMANWLTIDGDQVRMSTADLERAVANTHIGESITFQFWLLPRDSTDVVSRYTPLTEWLTLRKYWLDGLNMKEKDRVISLVCSQIAVPSPRTIALVVDRYAAADNIDWDQVVQERGGDDRHHADLYLMS